MAKYPFFVNGAYVASSVSAAADECINLYVEDIPPGGQSTKNTRFLTRTPGRRLLATIPDPPVRGICAGDGCLFVAGGSKLFELDPPDFTPVAIGVYQYARQPVLMYLNGTRGAGGTGNGQLFVATGGFGFVQDGISLHVVVNASYPAYLDGYFIAAQPNSNQFNLSALLNGLSWDPLQFATKQGAADRLVAIWADHEELWLIGARTSEVWYDAGGAGFPFARIQGAFIELGTIAPYSVQKLDNSLFWLGQDDRGAAVVWRMQGYLPVRVSTHAVESQWIEYADLTDAVAYTYQEAGHSFYVLNFPTGNATWVYDCATNLWHRRGVWNPAAGRYDVDAAFYHAFLSSSAIGSGLGMHIVGDHANGNIYEQSLNLYADAAQPNGILRAQRTAPHLDTEMNWNYYRRFVLDCMSGGNSLNQAADAFRGAGNTPQAMLQFSDDGGFTWSNELWASMGAIGQYRWRVEWRGLGRAMDRCFRVAISDPIQLALIDAYLEISQGQ